VERPKSHLPDRERISVLAGMILMAFSFTPYVDIPAIQLNISLPGVILPLQFSFHTIVSILVSAMTASGADWLVRGHPAFHSGITIHHWLLPALTAWVIGGVLFTVPFSPWWWVAFAVGGILLTVVLVAEYIVVDPADIRYPFASAGLAALAFGLFLALAITLHAAELRLFLQLPFLVSASALVALRVFHLRLEGKWAFSETSAVMLICAQLVAIFHYWSLSSSSFGLILVAPLYGVINFIANLEKISTLRRAIIEPVIPALLMLAIAIVLA
jgi:hypothetical protein